MVDIVMTVDKKDADRKFARLMQRINPSGLRLFLEGPTRAHLARRMVQRFQSEGDDASGKWQALRESTAMIRSYLGYGAWGPINRRTGALYSYATSSFLRTDAAGATLEMPGRGGSANVREKMRVAQQGGSSQSARKTGPNRPTPARPIAVISGMDQRVITTELMDWIQKAW